MTASLERVGEVLELQRRPVDVDFDGVYEEIGIRSFGRGVFHKEPISGADLGSKRVFWIEPGDLLLSNVFAWEGAVAIAGSAERGKIGSHRFMTYTATDDRIDTTWASWFFRSEPGLELIRRASPGSAGRNRTLSIDRFEALLIPVPPIDEQLRIAAELNRIRSTALHVSALSTRALELSGALAVSMASRPDMSDSEKLAAGWDKVALGDVLTPTRAPVRVDAFTTYPNIGIYSFGRGVFGKPGIDGSSTSASTLFRVTAGQFIYSRLFAFEGAYACVPEEFDGYFVSNEFPTFNPDVARIDSRWLATYLRSPSRWAELAGFSKGIGVRRQRVPVEAVLEYRIWLPPIDSQQAASDAIRRLAPADTSRELSSRRVDSLLDAALNAAFSDAVV